MQYYLDCIEFNDSFHSICELYKLDKKGKYFVRDCLNHWARESMSQTNLTFSFIQNIMKFEDIANNTLMYLPSASYPYPRGDMNNIIKNNPNILELISMFNKHNSLIVKIIYTRRPIIDIFASVCRRVVSGKFVDVNNLEGCIERINKFRFVLSEMHRVLSYLDKRYWIMIDYNDLITRPRQYAKIVTGFLQIQISDHEKDKHLIENLFQNKIKQKNVLLNIINTHELMASNGKWDELREYMNYSKQKWLLTKSWIYKHYFNYKYWPIFANHFYLTTPETFR